MRRGSLVELNYGVVHIIAGVRGIGASYPSTYCDVVAANKLETQTSIATCVACLAARWRDMGWLGRDVEAFFGRRHRSR